MELVDKVLIAKKEGFESENLNFISIADFDSIDLVDSIVLLGGVLQYPEHPYEILENIVKKRPLMVVPDRTPVLSEQGGKERFYVQNAPSYLGGSSHPLRILNRQRLEGILDESGYQKFGEHDYGAFPRDYSEARYIAQIWIRSVVNSQNGQTEPF